MFVALDPALVGKVKLRLMYFLSNNTHTPPLSYLRQLRQSVASSGYTKTFPTPAPRPQSREPEARFAFDRSRSVLNEELAPHPPKTPLADKVRTG